MGVVDSRESEVSREEYKVKKVSIAKFQKVISSSSPCAEHAFLLFGE